jgi:hypothetical protein
MLTSREREILEYLSEANIKFVVPEDKEHDYFYEKKRKIFNRFKKN